MPSKIITNISLIATVSLFLIAAKCNECKDCKDTPAIEMKSLTFSSEHEKYVDDPLIEKNLSELDSIFIILKFKDGDGDLGGKAPDPSDDYIVYNGCLLGALGDSINQGGTLDTVEVNAFIEDSRTGCIQTYAIPHIPARSNSKAISGEIEITKLSDNCRQVPSERKFDTVSYNVYIQDRAGNISNTVSTPSVVIRCRDDV